SETKGRNVRKIPLKDNVFNVLMELVNSETTNQSIDGISGFLFSYKGKVYSPNALRKNMCDMVEKYNQIAVDKIEEFTPKTLRHTGCTMYSREGLDISVLQYILGHKSSYTTMRFYNHTTEERALYTFREHVEKSA
ncbi:MAG: site-specific integrase, partial [Lachnospiraceae bacterium]|nr:site-specific integrase [Lachnospiraceae bacterium]